MKVTNVSTLKKHLSARLHEVQAGEEYLVTDRDVPVALLEPVPAGMRNADMAGLIATGVMAPRRRPLDVRKLRALPRGNCTGGLSPVIEQEREGR